jgi:hypothetical protein
VVDIFSDDSGAGNDRFRSLALVGIARADVPSVRAAIAPCFTDTPSVEWKDVNGDSRKQACARRLVKEAVRLAAQGTLSITILSWDLRDSRHAIPGRNDFKNAERMYYHAIAAIGRKCGATALCLYPDATNDALDFRGIKAYLDSTRAGRPTPGLLTLLQGEPERFSVGELREQVSVGEPLVQVADLFAGMARTSLERSEELMRWRASGSQTLGLFDGLLEKAAAPSPRQQAKFKIIDLTKQECSRYKLDVSLETRGHLWTPDPKNPIHFWLWEPQGTTTRPRRTALDATRRYGEHLPQQKRRPHHGSPFRSHAVGCASAGGTAGVFDVGSVWYKHPTTGDVKECGGGFYPGVQIRRYNCGKRRLDEGYAEVEKCKGPSPVRCASRTPRSREQSGWRGQGRRLLTGCKSSRRRTSKGSSRIRSMRRSDGRSWRTASSTQ